jgi:pimeloyl-[acyl-carrier protein] methyl ester esterase
VSALVVLPGLDGLAVLSSAFAAAARSTFDSVVAVSYPTDRVLGYAELEAHVRDSLPKETPYVLLGQSFSGPIAIAIAASQPPRLIGLVLSTTFSQSPLPWLSPLASLARIAPVRSLPDALLSWWLLGRWATPQLESMLQSSLQAVKRSILRSRAAGALRINVSSSLKAISTPVLYLRASDDRLLSRAADARIVGALPHAEAAEVVGPHLLLQASPEACAEVVARFASRLGV